MTRPDASTITDDQLNRLYAELETTRQRLVHEQETAAARAADLFRLRRDLESAQDELADRRRLAARCVELEQQLVAVQGELERHQADLYFAEHSRTFAARQALHEVAE